MGKVAIWLSIFIISFCSAAAAQTIVYVPMDDRPVNLVYVRDTFQAAGVEIIVPPKAELAGRGRSANPERLWDWVLSHAAATDSMVLSADSMIYGGLVASRTHFAEPAELSGRLSLFKKLKEINPALRVYVFSTIMRTPKMSAGNVEPPYYEQYGPKIFQITALRDKKEVSGLTGGEQSELDTLLAAVPAEHLLDWTKRRDKNFQINTAFIEAARKGDIDYFLLGRDDCSPLSASHQESRKIGKLAVGISPASYQSFPGADQLGMLMVTRAYNDGEFKIPFVMVYYSPGIGEETIPSYEDRPVGETLAQQIIAAGGLVVSQEFKADLILAVNTPLNGKTGEANFSSNTVVRNAAVIALTKNVKRQLNAGYRVAVGDISFANGADNALMAELSSLHILEKLDAYSGWNTAGNTLGYAIGQGVMAPYMTLDGKNRLKATRLLDDWAYQANVRGELYEEVVYPGGGNGQYLNEMLPRLEKVGKEKIQRFAEQNITWLNTKSIEVSFPWNRMFEMEIKLGNP